jgi:ABC-type protease/lipase transport system fused ATPase/permease subunit
MARHGGHTLGSLPGASVLRSRLGLLGAGFLLSGILNALLLSASFYAQQVYDHVLPARDVVALAALTGLVLLAHTAFAATDLARARLLHRVAREIASEIDRQAFDAFRASREAEVLRCAACVGRTLASSAPSALFDVVWSPAYVAAAFALHPMLGLFAALGGGLLAALTAGGEAATRARLDALEKAGRGRLALASRAVQRPGGSTSARQWDDVSAAYFDRQTEACHAVLGVGVRAKAARAMLQSGGLAIGALLVVNGSLGPGDLIASCVILGRTFACLDQALVHWRSVVAAGKSYAVLARILPLRRDGAQILNSSMLAKAERRASDQPVESFRKYSSSWEMRFSRRTSRVSRS